MTDDRDTGNLDGSNNDELFTPGTAQAPLLHLSPLIPALIGVAAVGKPHGWIGFLLPIGPLLALAAAKALGRTPNPAWRLTLAFSLICALLIGGSWGLLRAAGELVALRLLFPFAVLAFFLGLVNFLLVTISRSLRAWKSQPLEYPWIPGWLDRPLGLTPTIKEM